MAWFALEWVFGLDKNGKALGRFGLGLAVATLLLYAINMDMNDWFVARCDANSALYVSAQLMIAVSMLIMSTASPYLSANNFKTRASSRLILGGTLAGLCVGLLLLAFPQCSSGPFSALSDELITLWMSKVVEAKNLTTILTQYPEYWFITVAYSLLIFATGTWVLFNKLENKFRLAIIFAAFIASVLLTFIQYRTIRIGFFAAIPICVIATELVRQKLIARFGKDSLLSALGQIACVIFLSTASWTFASLLIKPYLANSTQINSAISAQKNFRGTCFLQSDHSYLASLPKGHVISGLNSAPAILVFTKDKSVVAGPYHRNQQGILDVLKFFAGDSDSAHEIALRNNIDYVALCRRFPKSQLVKSDNNNGANIDQATDNMVLEKQLLLGKIPHWLKLLSPQDDKMLIFRVNN